MTKKHAHHAERHIANVGTDALPLFERPNTAERKRDRERLKERLLPLVDELAERHGPEGITASELISVAIEAGVLPGPAPRTDPRRDAWTGPWLAALGRKRQTIAPKLVDGVHVRRRSERDVSHANENRVYVGVRFAA